MDWYFRLFTRLGGAELLQAVLGLANGADHEVIIDWLVGGFIRSFSGRNIYLKGILLQRVDGGLR